MINILKILKLLLFSLLITAFCYPAVNAYYQWLDENGKKHFTQDLPPADAKNLDGSSFWGKDDDEVKSKLNQAGVKREYSKPKEEAFKQKKSNSSLPESNIKQVYPSKGEKSNLRNTPDSAKENSIDARSSHYLYKWWDSTRVDTGESTGPLNGIWGSSKDDIFVVGAGEGIPLENNRFLIRGGIFHYDGRTWSEMSNSDDEFLNGILLHSVWGSSSKNVYAVGSQWTILHYDGNAWSQVESGLYSDTGHDMGEDSPASGFWSIWGSSANDIYAVGGSMTRGGVALHFDGDFWREISLPDNHRDHYCCVWGTSGKNIFILGNLGRAYHYNGSTWEAMNIGQPVNLTAIWGTSDDDVFAAGYGGKIFHYDGEEWSEMCEFKGMDFSGIWGSSGKNIYAAGTRVNDGAIFHYNGTKWKKIKTVNGVHLGGIWGNGEDDVFAVGTGNLILHYSGISIFTSALGALGLGLGIFGWRLFRKNMSSKRT